MSRNCFIIGPMKDRQNPVPRLTSLKINVVQPLLDEVTRGKDYTYTVRTPYDTVDSDIMNNVIKEIDRAHIVVADITGSNANVLYELGICHSLGRAVVVVKEDGTPEEDPTPFDIAAYRYTPIRLNASAFVEAKDRLRDVLFGMDEAIDSWRVLPNPVTSFYGAPITNISPAVGLAYGYFFNFVKLAIERLLEPDPEQTRHQFEVTIKENDTLISLGHSFEARRDVKLWVIIPTDIDFAHREEIDRMKRVVPETSIQTFGRPFTLYSRRHGDSWIMLDIPSTLSVLEYGIVPRMDNLGDRVEKRGPDWRRVEREELERFVVELRRLINRERRQFRNRVVIRWFNYDSPDDDLRWLRDVLK